MNICSPVWLLFQRASVVEVCFHQKVKWSRRFFKYVRCFDLWVVGSSDIAQKQMSDALNSNYF